MNLLARILSHGFAVAIVAFLIIGFMYRGELFPEWELPEYLGLNKHQEQTGTAAPADGRADVAGGAPVVLPPSDSVPVAPGSVPTGTTDARDVMTAMERAAEPGGTAAEPGLPRTPAGTMDGPASRMSKSTDAARMAKEVPITAAAPAGSITTTVPETAAFPVAAPRGTAGIDRESGVRPGATGMQAAPAQTGSRRGQVDAPAPGATGAVTAPVTAPALDAQGSPAVPPPARELSAGRSGLQTPAAAAKTVIASPYQLLAAARESFWLRDYSGAERQYRQLIDIEPDNPDGYGELGNMYFSQGEWDAAASAYYEAGARLVTAGKLLEAGKLAEVIRGLDGARADDLGALIDAAESTP